MELPEEKKREEIKSLVASFLSGEGYRYGKGFLEFLCEKVYLSLFGLWGLERYLRDPEVTEIMVNSHSEIFVERRG